MAIKPTIIEATTNTMGIIFTFVRALAGTAVGSMVDDEGNGVDVCVDEVLFDGAGNGEFVSWSEGCI